MLKEKNIEREGDITDLLEVNVQGGFLMERDASIEPFSFVMAVIGSTGRPRTLNNLGMIVLKHIITPLFVFLDMFHV